MHQTGTRGVRNAREQTPPSAITPLTSRGARELPAPMGKRAAGLNRRGNYCPAWMNNPSTSASLSAVAMRMSRSPAKKLATTTSGTPASSASCCVGLALTRIASLSDALREPNAEGTAPAVGGNSSRTCWRTSLSQDTSSGVSLRPRNTRSSFLMLKPNEVREPRTRPSALDGHTP